MTTQVVLLGTGTPNAEPDRHGSALAIIVDDHPYLVDFGPGVVRRIQAAQEQGIPSLDPTCLQHAFLTHLHSDHTLGYADLIFTSWTLGREEPLIVYGPPGLQAMTDHLLAAYAADIAERLHGLEPANSTGFQVIVHEIEPGVCYEDARVTVEAFAVSHGSWPAYGYRFSSADRVIVISGDTCPVESIVPLATGCDMLIHEVYSVTGFADRSPDWQAYHRNVHTSTHELAALANRVQPGLLVLVHQLLWGVTPAELVAEITDQYAGEVVYGRDLDVF